MQCNLPWLTGVALSCILTRDLPSLLVVITQHLPCRHVNQKALDQFTAFQDQRTDLARRQRENAQGEDKIRELIANLDQRKNDAIQTTFKACAGLLLLVVFCLIDF